MKNKMGTPEKYFDRVIFDAFIKAQGEIVTIKARYKG